MEKEKVSWFVEPLNAETNRIISIALADMGLVNESSSTLAHTYQNKAINTWRVERTFVLTLINSRKQLGLEFRIFYQKGLGGKLILWRRSKIIHQDKKVRLAVETGKMIKLTEKALSHYLTQVSETLKQYQISQRLADRDAAINALKKTSKFFETLKNETDSLIKILSEKIKKATI